MKTEKVKQLPYEPAVGSVYTLNGVTVRCEEHKGCTGCYGDMREHSGDAVPCRIRAACTVHSRKDKKSIILKLVR